MFRVFGIVVFAALALPLQAVAKTDPDTIRLAQSSYGLEPENPTVHPSLVRASKALEDIYGGQKLKSFYTRAAVSNIQDDLVDAVMKEVVYDMGGLAKSRANFELVIDNIAKGDYDRNNPKPSWTEYSTSLRADGSIIAINNVKVTCPATQHIHGECILTKQQVRELLYRMFDKLK